MPKVHELKTWTREFRAIQEGRKTCDHRKDDRGYRVGDILRFREYDPTLQDYSGQLVDREVGHIERNTEFGIMPGFVVMSMRPPPPARLTADVAAAVLVDWHGAEGDKAAARANALAETAARNRREGAGLSADRLREQADLVRQEASFHHQAAALIRELAASQPDLFGRARTAFSAPVDNDTPLEAAAREAGWALMEIVDELPWERRHQVRDIAERLAATLSEGA